MTRQELRQRVNAEDIRNWYRFDKSKGRNMYCCPVCGSGTGTHRTGALQINEQGNRVTCHSGGCFGRQGEDTLGALKILLKTDEDGVFEYMRLAKDDVYAVPSATAAPARKEAEPVPEADYTEFFTEAHSHINSTNYPQRRGLTRKTLERFNIGFVEEWRHPNAPTSAPLSPRLIIPTGKSSYLARDVRENVPERQKPYIKSKCGRPQVFNPQALYTGEASKAVYVVEGEIDAMSLEEVGCAALGLGGLGNVSKLFTAIDAGIAEGRIEPEKLRLMVALDNENNPGIEDAAQNIENGCAERSIYVCRVNPCEGYKDPNEALVADRAAFTAMATQAAEGILRPYSIGEYLQKAFAADIESFQASAKYSTGFKNLDAEMGHIYPGLYVLGAISSLGKTTFSLQAADQLAEAGHDVLFFSLEQSRFELVCKSLSREMAQENEQTAMSALAIRARFGENATADGRIFEAVQRRIDKAGHHLSIIEGNMNTTLQSVVQTVHDHVRRTGRKPVVFIDYLQILKNADTERNAGANQRETTDRNVAALKILSRDLDIPVFAISSINRSNYLAPIDFESFKESGCIEYSADVVWGLQLRILNDDTFDKEGKVKEKREKVKAAKAEIPRKIELVCLKNRFGKSSFSCYFDYDPRYDLYKEAPAQMIISPAKMRRL